MTDDEFKEYKYIIVNALELVGFSDRVNIVKSEDTICVFSGRTQNIAVVIAARGPEFNIMYFDCGFKENADVINLATPDSVQVLGELLKGHLKVQYGRLKGEADLGQRV